MKKILFFSHDNHLLGATRSMIDIADHYRKNNIDAKIVIPTSGPIAQFLEEKKIPYKIIYFPTLIYYDKMGSVFNQFRTLFSAFRHLSGTVKYLKYQNPDLVYINSIVNYWLLILAYFLKKKYVLHLREFGKEDHNIMFFFNGFLLNLLKKKATVFIANSNAVCDNYKKNFNIHSIVVYNGVLPEYKFIENLGKKQTFEKSTVNKNMIVIGMVGNIAPGKGQLAVLKAFHVLSEKYANLYLIFVGGGRAEPINNYIEEHNLATKVEITGFKYEVDAYYLLLDILIMNSDQEAFGRVAVEASSFGIPVLGRNTGATPEIISELKTGLIHDGSVNDMAEKLELLIQNSALRKKFGKEGWKHTKDLFSFESSISKIDDVFNKLLC